MAPCLIRDFVKQGMVGLFEDYFFDQFQPPIAPDAPVEKVRSKQAEVGHDDQFMFHAAALRNGFLLGRAGNHLPLLSAL